MEPAFRIGDIVILEPASKIQVGDVIAYDVGPKYQKMYRLPPRILHRVVAVDKANHRLTTKGDASKTIDPFPVSMASVRGKVSRVIPYLGYIIMFLTSTYGKIWVIVISILFLLPLVHSGAFSLRDWFWRTHEHRLDQIERNLEAFARVLQEYAVHLKSHTSAIQHLDNTAAELREAVRSLGQVLYGVVPSEESAAEGGGEESTGDASENTH
jgi:signal peptidase I